MASQQPQAARDFLCHAPSWLGSFQITLAWLGWSVHQDRDWWLDHCHPNFVPDDSWLPCNPEKYTAGLGDKLCPVLGDAGYRRLSFTNKYNVVNKEIMDSGSGRVQVQT